MITDGAIVVAESGAIIEYLTRKHAEGRLAITDPNAPEFADYLHWLHYAEGSAVTPMLFELYLRLLGGGNDQLSGTVNAQIVQQLTYIEGALRQRSFFVGSRFTAADIQMTFVLEFAQASGRLSRLSAAAGLSAPDARPRGVSTLDRQRRRIQPRAVRQATPDSQR